MREERGEGDEAEVGDGVLEGAPSREGGAFLRSLRKRWREVKRGKD